MTAIKFGTDGWRAVISETFTFANLRLVAQAIANLPEKEKLVVSLYYYDELTMREIGEVLGLSEKTVRNHVSNIFSKLQVADRAEAIIRARELEIPKHLLGRNFRSDRDFRRDLEEWVSEIWREKDQQISNLIR